MPPASGPPVPPMVAPRCPPTRPGTSRKLSDAKLWSAVTSAERTVASGMAVSWMASVKVPPMVKEP